MRVERIVRARPQQKDTQGEPRVDGKRGRAVGGPGEDGIAIVVEERGIGRLAAIVRVLDPGERRRQGTERVRERTRRPA